MSTYMNIITHHRNVWYDRNWLKDNH